ncbi:hypothetical protein BDW62DRAFT_176994 [Aspergillus aurantiobrunneus]
MGAMHHQLLANQGTEMPLTVGKISQKTGIPNAEPNLQQMKRSSCGFKKGPLSAGTAQKIDDVRKHETDALLDNHNDGLLKIMSI